MDRSLKNKLIAAGIVAVLAAGGWTLWQQRQAARQEAGFLGSNGRIEATEVDVATKLAGRVEDILVDEGAFVKAGQVLATMQVQTLNAQLREAQAQRQQSLHAVASAQAQVAMRQSDKAALLAQVRQAEAELDAARRRLARSETLTKEGAASAQTLDDDRARARGAEAAI
ncbi:MAG: biotin/lipoyl-binding protein, partial [Xenophilus sp.]